MFGFPHSQQLHFFQINFRLPPVMVTKHFDVKREGTIHLKKARQYFGHIFNNYTNLKNT